MSVHWKKNWIDKKLFSEAEKNYYEVLLWKWWAGEREEIEASLKKYFKNDDSTFSGYSDWLKK